MQNWNEVGGGTVWNVRHPDGETETSYPCPSPPPEAEERVAAGRERRCLGRRKCDVPRPELTSRFSQNISKLQRGGSPAASQFFAVPEGRPKIAHRFIGGLIAPRNSQAPPRAKENVLRIHSAVPPGLDTPFPLNPALKRWAIFEKSLNGTAKK